jgi:hypothetical protein
MTPLIRAKTTLQVLQALAKEPLRTLSLLNKLPFALRGRLLADAWAQTTERSSNGEVEPRGHLRAHFDAHREGPGIWKWLHYFDIYERHLKRFVGREVRILEIGVYSGGSLDMWHSYFGAHCHVYGVDIEPACVAYEKERTHVLIGDQADRGFWRRVRAEVPRFDIVVDDGGHEPEQQIVTLEEVFPHINPGGVYLCEDIVGHNNAFATYAHALTTALNEAATMQRAESGLELSISATPFQADVHSIHFYPLVCVIEKNRAAVERFSAPKHGTSWQPYL